MKRSRVDGSPVGVRLLRTVLVAPIVAYQRFISPALPQRCKYYPSCSAYAVDAIREVGPIRGLILAGWRLLRCNPFSHGGYDPIDHRPFFRPKVKPDPAGTARRRTRERAREEQGAKFASELGGGLERERAEAEYVAR